MLGAPRFFDWEGEEGRRRSPPSACLRRTEKERNHEHPIHTFIIHRTIPRRGFDKQSIEGLAASIGADGLLQNLVVKPINGKGERYRIVSGERRYRALKLLEERGELAQDFTVPVEIREKLSKDDTLRLATVENLQRQNLTPLEEAAALTKLIHKKVSLEDIAAQTGLSPTTIRRRLALNDLCEEADKALREGGITLSQAEALTLGDHDRQRDVLDDLARGYYEYSGAEIRDMLLDERPTVALAIFPVEQYSGTITTDLFGKEEESYFDDAEQFFELQKQAVAELAAHHADTAAWVEVTERHSIPDWQYEKAEDGAEAGVVINLSPSGKVEIREGLVKPEIEPETAKALAENPAAPKTPKAFYATPLRRYIAHHKTAAVQEVLLADPRKAKEVEAVHTLHGFTPHDAIRTLANTDEPQSAYAVREAQAQLYAGKLGFDVADDEPVWTQFPPPYTDDLTLYEVVNGLSDADLDGLHTLLSALRFGQVNCERLETQDSLFNSVAQDLAVDIKCHWRPDRSFLERRNKDQLIQIAKECGYTHGVVAVASYKKGELVSALLRHFEHAHAAAEPTEAQVKAREWLPEAMRFPAVDPDATETEEGDTPEAA